jgi:GNAT superfamily N-acetyltransferase
MSGATGRATRGSNHSDQDGWKVREASLADAQAVAAGISALLEELGGRAAGRAELEAVARTVIGDPNLGCVLVGETAQAVVGVLAASWQTAIHAGGRYGLIQDLWVAPAWRDSRLGSVMIDGLIARARADGVNRIEVGLPSHRYPRVQRTEAFYVRNGFAPVGWRMRRSLR